MGTGRGLWSITPLVILMHLAESCTSAFFVFLCDGHFHAMLDFIVKEIPEGQLASHHFLKTHKLCDELRPIGIIPLRLAAFVLYRNWEEAAFLPHELNSFFMPNKFHHIADAADPKLPGMDRQSANDQPIPSFFPKEGLIRHLMNIASL